MTRLVVYLSCALVIGLVSVSAQSNADATANAGTDASGTAVAEAQANAVADAIAWDVNNDNDSEECNAPDTTEATTTVANVPQCGDNEILDECPAKCGSDYCPKNEREASKSQLCVKPEKCPPPACKCRVNYRRNSKNVCIPTRECPPFKCSGVNEEFNPCPPFCPTDDCSQATPDGTCPKRFGRIGILLICSPKCRCMKGYWRKNGVCVPYAECNKCNGPNEEHVLEKQTCPPETCTSIVARYDCSKEPPRKPGCACKSGFLRLNDTSPCIPFCECPQVRNSPECKAQKCNGPNEEYVQEKQSCPPETCRSIAARYDCRDAPPPQPGCACKPGFLRHSLDSPCVPSCECPQIKNLPECKAKRCTGPNEEYVQEKRTCPPETCLSIVARFDCSQEPPRKPGCACKSGFLRLNDTSPCIPFCECPEVRNTDRCKAKTCSGPNEEYVHKKQSCPPETCRSIVSKYDCSEAPPPQPGCACKPGFLRLSLKSPCIPSCECPEMRNTPECRCRCKENNQCSDPNEEYVPEKPSCPPEECNSMVARIDCTNEFTL